MEATVTVFDVDDGVARVLGAYLRRHEMATTVVGG